MQNCEPVPTTVDVSPQSNRRVRCRVGPCHLVSPDSGRTHAENGATRSRRFRRPAMADVIGQHPSSTGAHRPCTWQHAPGRTVHRYYDPTVGQFISPDPLVQETGDLYGYAGGDPVNSDDPSGLCDNPDNNNVIIPGPCTVAQKAAWQKVEGGRAATSCSNVLSCSIADPAAVGDLFSTSTDISDYKRGYESLSPGWKEVDKGVILGANIQVPSKRWPEIGR